MKTTIRVDGLKELKAELQKVTNAAETVLKPAAVEGGQVIQEKAKSKAPGPHVETEVKKVTGTKVEVAIGPDKEHWYYRFFETGTDAHEIDPKNKEALAWPGAEGQVVIAEAWHTGMPAEPFLRPAMDEAKDEAINAVMAAVRRAIT